MKYNHKRIEKKWQGGWAKLGIYKTKENYKKPKCYVLDMFPYPSGEGLHVGHPKGYIATDIYSRFKTMNGFSILHPMGWDAFGLPAENFAIKHKIHPRAAVRKNIRRFKEQLSLFGFNYDWNREINTTDPEYYRWTQWIFLQLFKKGLAYESYEPINWCPSCKTGLANEDLDGNRCERCETVVKKRPMRQWMLRITQYADRLLKDLEKLDWPDYIKEAQRNWIGRSEGAEIDFEIKSHLKYVLLHGFRGSPEAEQYQWLKKELEMRGAKVTAPALPHPNNPREDEQVSYALQHAEFDINTVLYGKSLGVPVALKVVECLNKPIAGLVLAGGFLHPEGLYEKHPFDNTFRWEFDFEKIKKNCGFIKIVSDLSDSAVKPEQGRILNNKLGGELTEVVAQKPHFDNRVEPSLLDALVPKIKIFTTRPDTLFGATYMVLAPEHALARDLKPKIKNQKEVEKYIKETKLRTEIERTAEGKEKTGVKLEDVATINPATKKEIPIFIADYVLAHYGTGAIMAVPAHDERDFEFAKKFGLPIQQVVRPDVAPENSLSPWSELAQDQAAHAHAQNFHSQHRGDKTYTGDGILINSGKFDGMKSEEAKRAITNFVGGKMTVQYKLRDWVFSRQRYWGEPIPIIHCAQCGAVPVPEKDLPVLLPEVKSYTPTGTGESPLAGISQWVNAKCPRCKGPGKRETNTMPQWAGSSWYHLRYIDPKNKKTLVDRKKEKYWSPVDMYVGGAEHATRHLIYARFWHKFLFDIGAVHYPEPFTKLQHVGLIMGEDGQKMSKRYGNVINPDDIIKKVGADALRLYEMFMGPFDQSVAWSTEGILGPRRFLDRAWKLAQKLKIEDQKSKLQTKDEKDEIYLLDRMLHKTIKKVTEDIEQFRFNTAISQLMILLNEFEKHSGVTALQYYGAFLKLLAPFAPHLADELWCQLGGRTAKSIHQEPWPVYNQKLVEDQTFELVIQINGKVRDKVSAPIDISQKEAEILIFSRERVRNIIRTNQPRKVIFIPKRLINIVI